MSQDGFSSKIGWTHRLEELFSQLAEKSQAYSWMHKRCEERFSNIVMCIDLPVIILSVVNASASIGSKSLFGESPLASICIGGVLLFTSILASIGSYFSWGRRAENHKISSFQFAKLYRFLSIELALPRNERMEPSNLLKFCRNEYDRLNEISPLIPPAIIKRFRSEFQHKTDVSFPEETGGIVPVIVFQEEEEIEAQIRILEESNLKAPPSTPERGNSFCSIKN